MDMKQESMDSNYHSAMTCGIYEPLIKEEKIIDDLPHWQNIDANNPNIKEEELDSKEELPAAVEEASSLKTVFECYTCGRKFISKRSLIQHLRTHFVKAEKECLSNNSALESEKKVILKRHLKNTSEGNYGHNATQKSNLVDHMKTHTGKKPYACNICKYRSARKVGLRNHMKTHTGKNLHVCNICEYKTAYRVRVANHMRIHTGEKPYVCNICEYRAAQPIQLAIHVKTHTGEKPYACNICEYRAARKMNLMDNMTTHTGEKPHACNICEFRMARKIRLTYHMKTHTGEKPYGCNICEYRAARKSWLVNHIKTHRRNTLSL